MGVKAAQRNHEDLPLHIERRAACDHFCHHLQLHGQRVGGVKDGCEIHARGGRCDRALGGNGALCGLAVGALHVIAAALGD